MLLTFKRELVYKLLGRIDEPRRFIQVVIGPRQVGKTTAVHQMLESWQGNYLYASAGDGDFGPCLSGVAKRSDLVGQIGGVG